MLKGSEVQRIKGTGFKGSKYERSEGTPVEHTTVIVFIRANGRVKTLRFIAINFEFVKITIVAIQKILGIAF